MSNVRGSKHRHCFRSRTVNAMGKVTDHAFWCKVRQPKKVVTLTLTVADVERALTNKGWCNSQLCAGAVCTVRLAEAFSHPVAPEGYADWFFSRAYIVSKTKNGFPVECYAYEHNSNIAQLFDTEAGLQELLKRIQKTGGVMLVRLHPMRKRVSVPGQHGRAVNRDGSRSYPSAGIGAKRRYFVAALGGAVGNES